MGRGIFPKLCAGKKILIVTDHKALVSLLNGNNKKNKTLFSRLTIWLDRLIPFDFQVEHKPGVKIGLADYLSRHPCLNPQPISTYDSMFTVAKISRIRSALGFRNKIESPSVTNNRRICNISNRKRPVEGERSCDGNWTNHRATNCISGRSIEFSKNSVGTIIEANFGYSKSLNSSININNSSNLIMERKIRKLLERHPSISSSDDIEEIDVNIQAITTEVRSTKTNTIISIPSVYPGESYPPVNPENKVMSIIPRNCKVVSKQSALPELFNLRFIESQYQSDPQLQAIIELIKSKDPQLHSKIAAISKYFAQYTQDFHVGDGCLWMDERLVIPNTLQTAVVNRLHYYHHGKSSMIDRAKDIWYPYMFRSLATITGNCPECTLAGKNLNNMCSKDDIGKILEPKEPNESVQLDFWGPINYLKESKKYVLVTVDRFSRWPSAMVCNSNRSDKIIKFLKAYIIAHGVPRQIRVDQGTNFMSKEVKTFCHEQGIEVLISPVNDHRATGCVERTIGSIKNSVLTYAREDKPEPLDRMVERALGALRFVKNASLNITPFEAHHGREANTDLRNLTKKPTLRNLNWENVIRSKYECLDERDPIAQTMPKPMDTNWGIRSDTEYDRKNRRGPLRLAEEQAANQDDEPGITRAPIDYIWSDECQISFENLKKQVANIVELRHFDIHRDTRIVCDASHNGLGAVLEQLNSDGWRPVSFASRYLNAAEKNYSTNELEMLAVVWGAEYFQNYALGRKFLIVTDHKALVSLLNGNNKKNKTLFSRLTIWLDRLIPFDFQVEHKPGVKIGLADYLSRHPCLNPQPISTYDSMFTVAKISRIRSALGFRNKIESPSVTNNRRICNISNRKRPVEGERSCDGNWTNHRATNCISGRSIEFSKNSVGTIIEANFGYSKSLNSSININNSSNLIMERKIRKLLERHPSISSSDDIEEIDVNIQAITTEVRSTKTNTIISIPSVYPGESYPPVNPENKVMSIIPRNCKVVSKQSALPELFNLRFIESQYQSDPQLQAIIELIKSKDPQLHSKIAAMSKYFAQYTQDFHVGDGCLWMDERLVIPNTLQTAVVNRLHYYHHGKSSMIDRAKDIWYPYMFRSLATIAGNCPECTLAGKNLNNMCSKDDIGKILEPKEPNESVQLDFWGPINYLKESKKYVLVTVDRFSRWPSAMVCNSNRSDKIIKFLKAYIIAHGVPRQIRVDQGTNFMSKEVKTFCHEQGIEVLISPVNDHRATGCVERTIGSIKNSVLTYAREDKPEPLDRMVERALGALRFVKNASLNITPFEAHHGREANTDLRNLTKKPTLRNLNWENVIRSKYECLDERDPIAQTMPKPMDTNWGIRSDTEYDRKNRRGPLRLAEEQAANQDDEPGITRAPNDPVEVPPAVVMQRTGERNMNRYRPLKSKIVDQTEHTIKMSNGAVLRKSGVALRKTKVPKKRVPGGPLPTPPTPRDLKRKLKLRQNQPGSSTGNQPGSSKGTKESQHNILGKEARFQILESAENSDSESEDQLPLSTTILVVKPTRGRENGGEDGQGTSGGGQDSVQPEVAEGAEPQDTNAEGTEPQETEREPEHISVTGGKKRGRKQRLVSYSSQDSASSLDETSSGRKRTAVTKMGGGS